jgi:hypothetical protein
MINVVNYRSARESKRTSQHLTLARGGGNKVIVSNLAAGYYTVVAEAATKEKLFSKLIIVK